MYPNSNADNKINKIYLFRGRSILFLLCNALLAEIEKRFPDMVGHGLLAAVHILEGFLAAVA